MRNKKLLFAAVLVLLLVLIGSGGALAYDTTSPLQTPTPSLVPTAEGPEPTPEVTIPELPGVDEWTVHNFLSLLVNGLGAVLLSLALDNFPKLSGWFGGLKSRDKAVFAMVFTGLGSLVGYFGLVAFGYNEFPSGDLEAAIDAVVHVFAYGAFVGQLWYKLRGGNYKSQSTVIDGMAVKIVGFPFAVDHATDAIVKAELDGIGDEVAQKPKRKK